MRLPDIVGQGYGAFWRFRGRYRVVKGSRGSKKSRTAALWYIIHMMDCPGSNLLVVRKVFRTLKDSCYADLQWAVRRLGVQRHWQFRLSPLEIVYKPTGQRIYFRGLDDPMKINSIVAPVGQLCWLWVEEAFEIGSEQDFDMLDEVIRGRTLPGLFKQVTLTFNPWDERHWLKSRFFDREPTADILAMTVDYRTNEFLDGTDLALFEQMRKRNPRRYQVAGLGCWGVHEGLIFEHWREERLHREELLADPDILPVFGLDFGYTNDPTALFCGGLDQIGHRLYVFDELYARRLSNREIFRQVAELGYAGQIIQADCAEPKSIDELRFLGLRRIRPVRKGPDSVRFGIQALQDYEIVVSPQCTQFIREISAYVWARDRLTGSGLNQPDSGCEDHLMDAMRYAVADRLSGPGFSFD